MMRSRLKSKMSGLAVVLAGAVTFLAGAGHADTVRVLAGEAQPDLETADRLVSGQKPLAGSGSLLPQFATRGAQRRLLIAQSPVSPDETLWNNIKSLDMADLVERFIERYPNSRFRPEAERRLIQLRAGTSDTDASAKAERLLQQSDNGQGTQSSGTLNSETQTSETQSSETLASVGTGGLTRQARGVSSDEDVGPDPQLVREIQAELKKRRFLAGPVDGIIGPLTRDAARRFVDAANLDLDPSQMDEAFLAVLGNSKVYAKAPPRRSRARQTTRSRAITSRPTRKSTTARRTTSKTTTRNASTRRVRKSRTTSNRTRRTVKQANTRTTQSQRTLYRSAGGGSGGGSGGAGGSDGSGGAGSGSGGSGSGSGGSGSGSGGSGSGSGGSGGTGGGGWSDARLKLEAAYLATTPSGLDLYAFRYVWGGPYLVGVMAQDVISNPRYATSVLRTESGFYKVDYQSIGLRMTTLEAWRRHGMMSVLQETFATASPRVR